MLDRYRGTFVTSVVVRDEIIDVSASHNRDNDYGEPGASRGDRTTTERRSTGSRFRGNAFGVMPDSLGQAARLRRREALRAPPLPALLPASFD